MLAGRSTGCAADVLLPRLLLLLLCRCPVLRVRCGPGSACRRSGPHTGLSFLAQTSIQFMHFPKLDRPHGSTFTCSLALAFAS